MLTPSHKKILFYQFIEYPPVYLLIWKQIIEGRLHIFSVTLYEGISQNLV